MYIVEIRDKGYFSVLNLHQQKWDTNQSEKKTKAFVFVDALKEPFEMSFNFFLEFFLRGVSLVRPRWCLFIRGFLIFGRLAEYAASMLWPKQNYLEGLQAVPHAFSDTAWVSRDAHLAYRIVSVTVVQTFHLKTQMSGLTLCCWSSDRWTNAMKGKTFSFSKF